MSFADLETDCKPLLMLTLTLIQIVLMYCDYYIHFISNGAVPNVMGIMLFNFFFLIVLVFTLYYIFVKNTSFRAWQLLVHTFNPSTWEAEACRFLSSRPAWSTE